MTRAVLAGVLALAAPRAATADAPPPAPAPEADRPVAQPQRSREIEIEIPGERSLNNKLLVGGLLAAGAIGSALGVYWHLDSRDASDAVSADEFTGEAWTDAHVAQVERAERSKTRASAAYAIGGAFLIATVVTYILTEPQSETAVIRTGVRVVPTAERGALVTRQWSF